MSKSAFPIWNALSLIPEPKSLTPRFCRFSLLYRRICARLVPGWYVCTRRAFPARNRPFCVDDNHARGYHRSVTALRGVLTGTGQNTDAVPKQDHSRFPKWAAGQTPLQRAGTSSSGTGTSGSMIGSSSYPRQSHGTGQQDNLTQFLVRL